MSNGLLDNMAPNAKRAVMVAFALAIVAIALYFFAVEPAKASLVREQKKLSDLQDKIAKTEMDLRGVKSTKERIDSIENELKEYEDVMLTPLLGSYAMRAKEMIEPLILGAGLTDPRYAEEPFRALPVTNPAPRQLHKRAAIRVTAKGSYQSAVSFLMRLEKELPLVTLQTMDFVAAQSPTQQSIDFVLEWPAKGDLTRP